jgi:hypothetical protein
MLSGVAPGSRGATCGCQWKVPERNLLNLFSIVRMVSGDVPTALMVTLAIRLYVTSDMLTVRVRGSIAAKYR